MDQVPAFDRHMLEIFDWPALADHVGPLVRLCFDAGELSDQIKAEAFMLLSLASGWQHCKARGG